MAHVLFVCLHNAGRSQMSEALFEQAAHGRHTAASAGTTPAERVHPEVIEVMRELDIDLSDRRPRRLDREVAARADVVVTMGCGDECPYIPGKRYLDWDLPDPRGRSLEDVRATRDQIAVSVRALLAEVDRSPLASAPGTRQSGNEHTAAPDVPLAECRLDLDGLREQRDRYGLLGAQVERVSRVPGRLVVEFGRGVDPGLLHEALAVERACCPFFSLDYDGAAHRLTAGVTQLDQDPALDALAAALGFEGSPP